MKLKETLCLPRTAFPMKAALPVKEPERLAAWEALGLEARLRETQRGRPKYVLHDGPPYANGHVHLGTAINKVIKDFVVKSRSQSGHDTPYVPGWDCHGMPIEHQVSKLASQRGETLSQLEVRRRCRAFADEFVVVQRAEFRRLGIQGEWDRPYLTTDPSYEGAIVGAFGLLHELGYIYKGLRSIHWCATCRTALANAEVEHDDRHRSPAIHVRFQVVPGEASRRLSVPDDAALLIWTTTPWTIPANVATAVHPELEYVLVGGDGRNAIVARALLTRVATELGWTDAPVAASWQGRELEGLPTRHPLFDRESPVVLATYVTTDAGTGAVHTAPGHGADDFDTGVRYGLPILVPVDKAGVFTAEAGKYAGRRVLEMNDAIIDDLRAAGALVREASVVHSYPTCWRCQEPLIFLATEQWFLRVEHDDLRGRCSKAVDSTTWVPQWGHDRMRDSIATRPDWCLSRQRAWGVPIPAFTCLACGEAVITPAVVASARRVIEARGSDAWFELPVEELAPPGTACGKCGATNLEKDPSILDVWFDSSCSHLAVLRSGAWPELAWPADLYVEAVDQHRGWFQVSLLNSVAILGEAPYRAVLTHGLILDEDGSKMSKSRGNVVSPDQVLQSHGADVLRLFFASVDSTADIKFSLSALEPVAESYRKVRNTLRFLLGNLADFEPARDAVAERDLLDLDGFALDRLRSVSAECRAAYEALAFNRVHRALLNYLTTDVSAFYAHVSKDRLYCDEPGGKRRRSAQTVLFQIAREVTQLLAPITCFTADEVWEALPAWPGKEPSIHLATWGAVGAPDALRTARWERLLAVRDEVLKALELARASGLIGDPLEAHVRVGLAVEDAAAVGDPRALAEACVVSELALATGPPPAGSHASTRLPGCWVHVERSRGTKCPRCWTYRADAGALASVPDACGRCAAVVSALGVTIDAA